MIQFDVNEIVEDNISPRIRKIFTLEFFKMCASPLVYLYNSFYTFFSTKKYELVFNGQVIYLEHVLNDQFDPVNRGIYISDTPPYGGSVYIFNDIEANEETFVYNKSEAEAPLYLFTNAEALTWPGFIVNVPSGVVFEATQLKAYVNKYKIASKNYTINIY